MKKKLKVTILICCILLILPSILFARNNEWARFSKNKYISSYAIQDSIHWIGTGVGLFKYNSNKDSLKYLSEIDSISTEKVDYIAKSDNGSVWFVIDGSSLFYFNKGNWINYSSSNSDLPEGKITKIATNNDDLLVIIDNRLMKFDGENWFCYPKLRDSFGETFRVNDIIVNTDIIWLHTTESIAAYHNWKWQELKLNVNNYYHYSKNQRLTQDPEGSLLFNFLGGINSVVLDSIITITPLENIEYPRFGNNFEIDSNGNFFIVKVSSTTSDLTGDRFYERDIVSYKIDGKKLIHLETISDIFNGERDIHQIEIDGNGVFWFHNRSNFYKLSNTKLKRINLWELVMPIYGPGMDHSLEGHGIVVDQQEEGHWTYTNSSNKIMMEGKYEEGKRIGVWKKYYSNGSIHEETEYKNGFRDGYYVNYYKSGSKWNEGTYSRGIKVGEWIDWNEQGIIREKAEYKNFLVNGPFTRYDIDGNMLYKGEKVNGIINGIYYQYSTNGAYGEKEFVNGNSVGEWNYFNSDGKPIYSLKYPNIIKLPDKLNENGNKQGLFLTFMNNNNGFKPLESAENAYYYRIAEYDDGVPQGIVRDYYKDGTLQFEGKMISEFPSVYNGQIRIYDATGRIKKERVYKNGIQIDQYDLKKIHPFSFLQVIEHQKVPLIFNPVSTDTWQLNSCKYLMGKIESEKECVPVISTKSTEWPEGKISTIGREAMYLLQGFIDGKYPPTECSLIDFNPKVKYYKKWWKKYQKDLEKK